MGDGKIVIMVSVIEVTTATRATFGSVDYPRHGQEHGAATTVTMLTTNAAKGLDQLKGEYAITDTNLSGTEGEYGEADRRVDQGTTMKHLANLRIGWATELSETNELTTALRPRG